MKTYIINSEHLIFLDSYENGETEQLNFYTQKDTVKANTPREAIQLYFEKTLCYSFNFENAYIYIPQEEEKKEIEYKGNTLLYSILVDADNCEASESEINQWKEDKKLLYSNNIYLTIFEAVPVLI
jgi:hypothetical protein